MKYGLLYYKDTDNIGDDIQAYAAARFLPRIDYFIDRENLESFVPSKKETVATIMNAWYVHDKFNFRISPYLRPLLVSMFFKSFPYEDGIVLGDKYINGSIKDTFKKYGPVGTRDMHTKKMMDRLGIDNYFSGCMTLTLEPLKNIKREDYIVVVGLSKKEISYIKKKTNRKVIEFIQDIPKGTLADLSWEERKKKVEETLRLYQGAHMVITNKLHCTLPNLALGTPVLLLYDFSFLENKDRIGTYLKYVNHCERKDFLKTDIDFEHPKKNPKTYLKLRNHLIKICTDFIENVQEIKEVPEIDFYKKEVEINRDMRKIIINELESLQKKYVKECEKCTKYYDKSLLLEEELNNIKNSRFYKVYTFLKNKLKKRNGGG